MADHGNLSKIGEVSSGKGFDVLLTANGFDHALVVVWLGQALVLTTATCPKLGRSVLAGTTLNRGCRLLGDDGNLLNFEQVSSGMGFDVLLTANSQP